MLQGWALSLVMLSWMYNLASLLAVDTATSPPHRKREQPCYSHYAFRCYLPQHKAGDGGIELHRHSVQ
jgi:hypothetical protein